MAKMIPGGAPDQSAFFLSRQAASNEALVRLYVSLLAKYNENREGENFKREMFDRTSDERRDYFDYTYDRQMQGQRGDDTGPDGARVRPRLGAEADARDEPPPAAPTAAAPALKPQPSSAPLGTTPILPSGKLSEVDTGTSGATDFSAQSRVPNEARDAYAQAPATATPKGIRPASREARPTNVLPGPAKGKNAKTVSFVDGMDQRIVDHFEQTEQKYGLPRHTLMTLFGLENDGGRNAQREGSVEGWFKFTDALAKEYNLNPNDRQDIYKMADYTAKNLIRNNMELKRINNGQGLSSDPADIPRWGILHQFGHTNGPLFLVAHQLNPDMPATAAMRQNKDPNVNYRTLVNNNLDPTASVDALIKRQAGFYVPWTNESFKRAGDRPIATKQPAQPAVQPSPSPSTSAPTANTTNDGNVPPLLQRQPTPTGKRSAIAGEDAYAQGGSAGSEVPFGPTKTSNQTSAASASTPPRPPANIPILHNARALIGVNRRLVDAVRGGAELALPEGYIVRAVSGREGRTDRRSHHSRGQAADFQIIRPDGTAIPHKGEDDTGMYTLLARGVKSWVRENDPDAERNIGYGGAFGTRLGGGGVPDLMHYDWGGSRGRMRPEVQFARLAVLTPEERSKRNVPAQPRVQVAGPVPAKEAPQPKKLPPGVVRPEYNKYEPDKQQHTPAEGYPPAGQFPPTHFGPQAGNTATMDVFGNFRDTAAMKMREGYVPPAQPAVLARSGQPEFELPMPQARPQTETGDLEYGSPSQPLPSDPNTADSADSTLLSVLPKPSPEPHVRPDDMAPDEKLNVPEMNLIPPDEKGLQPPPPGELVPPDEQGLQPGINDGLNALDVPMPRPRPLDPATNTPDIEYPDAAAAVAAPGGPAGADMLSNPPPQVMEPFPPTGQRRLPWAAIKQDVPVVAGNIKDAIFAIPSALRGAGSHIAGNANQLQQDVGNVAGSVADTARDVGTTAGDVASTIGTQADRYNTMVDSRQQELERLGAAIKENYEKYRGAVQQNVPTIDANRGPSLNPQPDARYKGALPLPPNEADDTPVSAEELKQRIGSAIFKEGGSPYKPTPPDYKASYDKIKDWIARKMAPSPTQPDVPPTPAKPATAPKPAAAPAKPAFVPPKMMPDGVTPWLPNSKPHHIVPKKKGPEDLLNVTGQPPPTSSTPTKVPPGPRRQQQPDAEVGFTIGPDGRFRPVLQPQQQAPVEEIQPAETE